MLIDIPLHVDKIPLEWSPASNSVQTNDRFYIEIVETAVISGRPTKCCFRSLKSRQRTALPRTIVT